MVYNNVTNVLSWFSEMKIQGCLFITTGKLF
jgi:hypothetical protein